MPAGFPFHRSNRHRPQENSLAAVFRARVLFFRLPVGAARRCGSRRIYKKGNEVAGASISFKPCNAWNRLFSGPSPKTTSLRPRNNPGDAKTHVGEGEGAIGSICWCCAGSVGRVAVHRHRFAARWPLVLRSHCLAFLYSSSCDDCGTRSEERRVGK